MQSQKSYNDSPTVYLIPTPIGNLEDITLRSINTLKKVDIIFSEDTRETSLLLKHLDIHKPLISSHNFNEKNNMFIRNNRYYVTYYNKYYYCICK